MTPLIMIVGIEQKNKLHVHVHCKYYMYADEPFYIHVYIVKIVMKKESLVRRGVDMDVQY